MVLTQIAVLSAKKQKAADLGANSPVTVHVANVVPSLSCLLSLQLNGQNRSRCEARGPFGGLPPWAPLLGPTSPGSGLVTPMFTTHRV